MIMPDIIDRAGRNFNADETDGVNGRDSLAGAPADAVAAARDTAMNPAVLDAFALAINASAGPPAFHGHRGSGSGPR
jgi:hypothetical protein